MLEAQRYVRRIITAAAVAALLAGCSKAGDSGTAGSDTSDRHAWSQAGVLRIATQAEVKNLNPLLASNTTDVFITRLMFLPLVQPDDKGVMQGALAETVPTEENGGIAKDGVTVTYHLRKDVKWSDGVPVTGKDVKWSWQAMMSKDNNVVSRHGYDLVRSIDTPDDYTVIVHLKQKFAPFVQTFFTDSDSPTTVAPEHVLSKYPNINQVPFNNEPSVVDGPFKFVEWSRGDHLTLARNDTFYLGKPKLDKIVIRPIADENTSVNELRTHGIDYMFQASDETYAQLKDNKDLVLPRMRVNGYQSLQVNMARPLLQDPRVRLAVAYAIDKDQLNRTLTYGQQTVATTDIPDWMWAHSSNAGAPTHDLNKAKSLLQEAGYTPGADGIMQKGGEKLSLLLVTNNSNVTRRRASVLLQQQLKQAGIDVEVKYFPGDVLFAPAGEGGILQLGKFDLSLAGWFAGIDPDDSSQFTCDQFPPSGYNYSRYCNKDMDAAQQLALTHYDQATRKKAYATIQQLEMRDTPYVYFWYINMLEPMSVDVKGFAPNSVVESWNAWQWSI